MNEFIQEVPHHYFQASAELSSQDEQNILEFMKNLTTEMPWQEAKKTSERLGQIFELITAQMEWIKENLGLSLIDRFEGFRKIKFYRPEEFDKIAIHFNKEKGWCGSHSSPSNEIIAKEFDNETQTLYNLSHELVHCFSRITLKIRKNENNNTSINTIRYGYQNTTNNTFRFFNEVITELINLDIVEYLKKTKKKDYIEGNNIGYSDGVIFFDVILDQMSKVLQKPIQEIKNEIYKGYFTGDMTCLKVFNEVFGPNALKLISRVSPSSPIGMQDFDLGERGAECDDRFQKYSGGQEIRLYGGIKLHSRSQSEDNVSK